MPSCICTEGVRPRRMVWTRGYICVLEMITFAQFYIIYNPSPVGPICAEEVDVCSTNHCPAPRLCKASEDGMDYICECPEGLSGPDCQQGPQPPCTGAACNSECKTLLNRKHDQPEPH